jgi:ADP-heptose:LPS heptosyltransferase
LPDGNRRYIHTREDNVDFTSLSTINSILIIKPSSLGDVVHTLPAVAAIRGANPDVEITWVINPEWTTLLRGNPDIDHVHIFPRGEFRSLSAPQNLLPWVRKTKMLRPDVALDFQGLLRSALIGKLSGAKELWGSSDGREGSRLFYNRIAKVDRRAHAVERYLKLAEAFGAPIPKQLRFSLPSGDSLPRFDPEPAFVLFHPFSRGGRKSLGRSVIEKMCRALAPIRVVLVGNKNRDITPPDNCVNLINQTTLLQLIWLIRAAQFTISVDSGPMHIAAALSSNLLSIHTWSDPRRVGPYNPHAWVWKNGQLLRVEDLPNAGPLKWSRSFKASDVEPVVELVHQVWQAADLTLQTGPLSEVTLSER